MPANKNFNWEISLKGSVIIRVINIAQVIGIPPNEGLPTMWIFLLSGLSNRLIELEMYMINGIHTNVIIKEILTAIKNCIGLK